MTTIKATCPSCGDVDLRPKDLTVTVAPAADWSTYTFRCPSCRTDITKGADEEVVTLLRGAGVRVAKLDIPAEALELHMGPPISHDDLLDFAMRLAVTDDIVQALAHESW